MWRSCGRPHIICCHRFGLAVPPVISEALAVQGRGRELFELMRAHDLEGIVAKRLADPYEPRVRWLKIKNPDYSQKQGRGDLFNQPR